MKKSLLSTIAMILACWGMANATVEITPVNIEQPAGDTLLFALPVDVDVYQDIQNYPENKPSNRMMKFQPEYLVTALDFTKGDVNKGTPTLPANAKVIGLGLDGYDVASVNTSKGIFLEVTAWCRNIPRDQMEMDYYEDLFDGYRQHHPVGDLFTDTITYRGYRNHPGYICTFDPNATPENPGTIVDIPFNNPDEEGRFVPFWYKGENIYLTLWMCNWEDVRMKYCYMAYDDAEAEIASLMRSGNYCFNSETYEVIAEVLGTQLMYELPYHRLPAFRTPYFTNDIRVTIEGDEIEYELRDAEGNVYTPDADGNFYSMDHTKQYSVFYNGKTRGGAFSFNGMYDDIDLKIVVTPSSVEDVDVEKAVASVAYYNLAGQQSAQPVDGVNIVVTTYTDGTRTTAKVIK